ncbi:MAG: lysoplasmalogenase [Acidobacteriota bacterium]|nr:lysoplasmalogenase [Acidobacteriota bacterium]
MTTLDILLTVLTAVSASAAIVAETRERRDLMWIFKPAAMIPIIILAALRPGTGSPGVYKIFLLAGLVAALAGDLLVIRIDKLFLAGLAAFLVAHLLNIRAFLSVTPPRVDFLSVLPLFLFALFMMGILFPYLGKLKIPVAAYILVITVMAGLAADRYVVMGGTLAFRAFAGAILFLISDAVLALNRFARKIPCGSALKLAAYFAAQWLLAMSI